VAPRRLKKLRLPEQGSILNPFDAGSLLSIYWKEVGDEAEYERWARDQWVWLNERGRIFTERSHVHTSDYRLLSTVRQPGERVPIELALEHPFQGLVMILTEATDGDRAGAVKKLEQLAQKTLLAGDVAILASWELTVMPDKAPKLFVANLAPPTANTILQLAFLRTDPEAAWNSVRSYEALIGQEKSLKLGLAAGLIPTVPGTTTHLDEI
jgi:hypothetical protein